MFIVNDSGNICEEVKSLKLRVSTNKTTNQKINRLPLSLCEKYEDKSNLSGIIINDNCFGVYENEKGSIIFQNIIDAIKRDEILFDLRIYNNSTEKPNND